MANPVRPFVRFLPAAVALAAAATAGGAIAQQSVKLEEVIVTAAKRQQTLQQIPVAVSVVTAESIERAQVLDIKDLQTLVPSLRVTQLQGSAQTNFIIRGFGNGANNPGIEPSVGVFIDGVYRSRVGSALADLPKLERVEVLRGPQSTLFGKNASAGVINVVTAKPDLTGYSASIGGTVGNYNQTIVRGDVTGPIADNLAFSLFGSMNQRDGYFDNLELGTEYNDLDRWNFRGQLLWNPSDRLEMRLIVDAEEMDEVCCGVANLVDGPTGGIVRLLGGDLVGNAPFAYENFYDFDPRNEIQTRGSSLQVDYDFDSFTLTSITAFRTLDQFQSGDVDFTSARLISPDAADFRDTQIDTFTQEFRLMSATDGPLQWVVGAFYFNEDVENNESFLLGPDFRNYADFLTAGLGAPGALGGLEAALGIPPGLLLSDRRGMQAEAYGLDDESLSLFAQVDYSLTERLTATVGLNYTQADRAASAAVSADEVFSSLPLDLFDAGGLAPLQFLPPVIAYPNAVESGESSDEEVTYTLRLAYDLTPQMNVYAGISTGFKPTSWNLSQDSGPLPADVPALAAAGALPDVGFGPGVANFRTGSRFAGPEESTVYEIGLKGEWNSLAVNAAVFSQEIDGFQSNAFTGTGFVLANAGKQSTDGVELDFNWAPLDGLRIGFALTWLDPLYDDFPGGVGLGGVPTDLSGQQPAGIPELATNTNVSYNFQLGSIASYVRVEHIYEDEVQVVDQIPADIASREVNTVNASAGITFDSGLEFNLWGRNLNEDEYLLSAFPSVAQGGSFSGYPNQPRTFGLTAKYNFE